MKAFMETFCNEQNDSFCLSDAESSEKLSPQKILKVDYHGSSSSFSDLIVIFDRKSNLVVPAYKDLERLIKNHALSDNQSLLQDYGPFYT